MKMKFVNVNINSISVFVAFLHDILKLFHSFVFLQVSFVLLLLLLYTVFVVVCVCCSCFVSSWCSCRKSDQVGRCHTKPPCCVFGCAPSSRCHCGASGVSCPIRSSLDSECPALDRVEVVASWDWNVTANASPIPMWSHSKHWSLWYSSRPHFRQFRLHCVCHCMACQRRLSQRRRCDCAAPWSQGYWTW